MWGHGRRKRHDVVRYAVYRTKGKGSLGPQTPPRELHVVKIT